MKLSRSVWVTAGLTSAFHLATATIYDYHRDEVYYLASGRRLAWGYVDHPPLTPFLYRVSDELFGASQFGLRIIPALLHGVIVLICVLLAREFGADNRRQVVAAVAGAVCPMYMTTGHFLTTVTAEIILWGVVVLLVVRLLKGGDPRLWLAVGGAVGLGLLDKWTTLYLVFGLGVGLLASPERRVLRTPWFAGGVGVALAVWAPNIVWQARHDWPQIEMGKSLRDPLLGLTTVPYQLVFFGAASVLLAWPAVRWLLRDEEARRFRALGVAFVVIVILVMATGGKPYYAATYGIVLLGVGAAVQPRPSGRATVAWLLGIGVLTTPFAMPLLPLSTAADVRTVNTEIGEMVGWTEEVDAVEAVYRQHPGATILTANYSQAGAIELLGTDKSMPKPISGHNSYWLWGHPEGRSDVTIAVGIPRRILAPYWSDIEHVTTYRSPHGVENIDDRSEILVLRGQRAEWADLWPDMRFYR